MALSYGREIEVFIGKHLDPQVSALAFADEVRRQLDDLAARGEVPRSFRHWVDGREGAPFRAVRPGGTIAASFTYNAQILAFALGFLRGRSPTRRTERWGRDTRAVKKPYRESFWVAIDGKFIRPGALNLDHVPEGPVELIVGNLQPYSRKVDVQTIGNRRLLFNVEPGLFADAARAVNSRFGNVVAAKRVHDIDFPGKPQLERDQMRAGSASHRVKRARGTRVHSPALIINPR